MEGLRRIFTVVAVLWFVGAAIPARAEVFDTIELNLGYVEGFGPQLRMEAQSVPVGTAGMPLDGLWTVDPRQRNLIRVQPMVWSDARGQVSGVVDVVMFSEEGNPSLWQEIPAKGRSRITLRRTVRPGTSPLPLDRGLMALEERLAMAANLSMRGRTVDPAARQPYAFNLMVRDRQVLNRQVGKLDSSLGGAIQLGSVDLVGRLNVSIPRQHVGRSMVQITDEAVAHADWYALVAEDMVYDKARGTFLPEGAVDSDSLGLLLGGTIRVKMNWFRPETNRAGRFTMNGVLQPFRFSNSGYTHVTLEQALDIDTAFGHLMYERITLREVVSCPGALVTFVVVGVPPSAVLPPPEVGR